MTVLSVLALSCLVVSCLVVSCLVLSYLILSCLTLQTEGPMIDNENDLMVKKAVITS